MSTRRSRIKAIANIPQRRKTETKSAEEPIDILPKVAVANSNITKDLNVEHNTSPENELHNSKSSKTDNVTVKLPDSEEKLNPCTSPINPKSTQVLSQRRSFIKPLVNVKSLSFRTKQNPEKTKCNTIGNTNIDESSELPNKMPDSAQVIVNLDNEITEPQSPTKVINRHRIKAIPRLTQRRISSTIHGSASESEDDSNKKISKRIRTESVCSTVSNNNENVTKPDVDVPQKRDFSTVIQRKCRRTEQSNKMAEARRNFINKFRNREPDKHKLTMLDLIFYNPTTKPMSQKPESQETQRNEEKFNDEIEESDEENVVPAPQIKIGANGEIVVDEKSLIVENKQTKKDRENLQKSEIVNGDFDTGYGIYKRAKRSKDWTKEDTLFFYKSLNTLGTDFSLMAQLFPDRNRRELKMKFKKEEKINCGLVDKALKRPLQFNIRELKEEAEVRQRMKELEKEERQKTTNVEKKDDGAMIPYSYKGLRKDIKLRGKAKRQKKKLGDVYSKVEKGIACIWETDTESEKDDESDEENDESTTDISNILKPTRYGRVPKQKTFTLEDPKVVKVREEHLNEEHQLEPGSLMIVCCQTPTGEPTFKVFMITGSQTKVPVAIAPDVLSSLTKPNCSTGEEVIPENNYTICHDVTNRDIQVEIQDDDTLETPSDR
ncbi:hypothetical protein FQA39_LY11906 [Lamprigera yunnana]|nr:hypothetical protein FQA39_LY11906 [Lamprigera yunnana]